MPHYAPREGDLPREQLMKKASATRELYGVAKCDIYFKFTCIHCGERCMLREPNVLHQEGVCDACGGTTTIEYGGYMLEVRIT